MNWNEAEGKWEQLKGSVMETWGKITDDDFTTIKGKRDKLLGKLQEIYGYSVEKAEEEIALFEKRCKEKTDCCSTKSESKDSNTCV